MSKMQLPEFRRRLSKASLTDVLQALYSVTVRAASDAEYYAKGYATTRLRVRSGMLRSSIKARPEVSTTPGTSGFAVRLNSTAKYAPTHEFGAMGDKALKSNRPGGFLAIPVHPTLKTRAGVMRYPGPRSVPDLFPKRTDGKLNLLHEETGEIWYALRKKVEVPARPFLRPSIERVEKNLGADLSKALRPVLGLRRG